MLENKIVSVTKISYRREGNLQNIKRILIYYICMFVFIVFAAASRSKSFFYSENKKKQNLIFTVFMWL